MGRSDNFNKENYTLSHSRESDIEMNEQSYNNMHLKYSSQPSNLSTKESKRISAHMGNQKDPMNYKDLKKYTVKAKQFGKIQSLFNILGSQERKSELRMSSLGVRSVEEHQEDYNRIYNQDILYEEENELQQQLAYKNTQDKLQKNSKKVFLQPGISKSPKPMFLYDNYTATPNNQTSDIRMSHQQALNILSQYEGINNRNPQGHIPTFKSHDLNHNQNNLLNQKKNSISSALSNSTNGTFSNNTTNTQNNANPGIPNMKKHQNSCTQQKDHHKKSQSLYNKKIIDIIQGLQQSLGVIANNVQNSFGENNNNNSASLKSSQEKALLESAMLAQKLAQMTSNLNPSQPQKVTTPNDQEPINKKIQKRKPSISKVINNNGQSGRSTNCSGPQAKIGFKTIEETTDPSKINNAQRISIEYPGKMNKISHQRTKSDVQNQRKITATQAIIAPTTKQIVSYHTKQNTLLACSQQSIDHTQFNSNPQPQQPQLVTSNSQLGKFLDDQQYCIISNQQSTKNRQSLTKQGVHHSKNHEEIEQPKIKNMKKIGGSQSGQTSILCNAQNQLISTTLDNHRQSLGAEMPKSIERLSEANYIMKQHHQNANLILTNNGTYEHKLKSAASSPSLHSVNNSNSSVPLKRKQNKQVNQNVVFDFQNPPQTSNVLQQNHQKIVGGNKKKTLMNSKNTQPQQKAQVNTQQLQQQQVANHKRSTSDGSSLTKMFHFKQQMMINKIFNQSNNTTNPQNSQQQSKKVSKQNSHINTQKTTANQSKVNVVSSLSSKRLSNEGVDENQENIMKNINYNSPRLIMQKPGNTNTKGHAPSQSQVFTEMKNFLQKFKDNTNMVVNTQQNAQTNQNPPNNNQPKQILIQAIQQQQNTRQNIIAEQAATSLSNGSIGNTNNKKSMTKQQQIQNMQYQQQQHQKRMSKNNPNSQSIENITPVQNIVNAVINNDKRQSQQIISKDYKNVASSSLHKRAKSDANQLMFQNTKQPKNPNVAGQRMFFLNLNQNHHIEKPQQQIIQNPQVIYSARASPTSSKMNNYYNLVDDSTQKGPSLALAGSNHILPTTRSDKVSCKKGLHNAFSNQTTQKKTGTVVTGETPQFNNYLIDSIPKARLVYNDEYQAVGADEKGYVIGQQQSVNKNLINNILYGNLDINKLQYQQNEDLLVSEIYTRQQSVNNSPKLKVLPTPKVVQPGQPISFDNGISPQYPVKQQLFMKNIINIQNSKNPVLSNFIIAPQNQQAPQQQPNDNKQIQSPQDYQKSKSNQQIEPLQYYDTMESQMEDGLSPRSKDKKKLIKLIKVSFNKLKEPIKTTGDFYRIGKMLGKGAFGRVNLAIHKLCEQLVAVKSINKQFLTEDESSKKKVMQEVLILQKTRHENIVKLFDSFETNKHIVFVIELCAGGDLLNYVRKRRKLKEPIAKYVFRQVVEGLYYCHSKGIVHRDIKLDNILLDEHGIVKICDFGVSRLLQDKNEIMTEQCGTPAYIAPEILKDKGYKGFGVDVWSLGVCLYAMLYGTVPFKANNMNDLHQLIMKAKYSLKDDKVELTDEVKGLIKQLLEPDPTKRMTIKDVRQHKWLEEAYDKDFKVEIFSEEEIKTIQKDFTYQDMARYRRNQDEGVGNNNPNNNNDEQQQVLETEHFFTEHALDSTTNALLKNASTKSVVLAPFNSTRSHIDKEELNEDEDPILPPLEIDEELIFDKKVIKYAARVKDINRQYEMNNNCELDNGVYNKFVKQSTENLSSGTKINKKEDQDACPNNNLLSQENSLVTSMNNEKVNHPQAPLVSQNSDDEAEQELIYKNQQIQSQSELQQLHTFLQMQSSKLNTDIQELEILIDYDIVERVELFGYPRQFIINTIENYEMNDAGTCYFLLDKEKQQLDISQC